VAVESVVERLADLDCDIERASGGQDRAAVRLSLQDRGEIFSFDVFHRENVLAVHLGEIVDVDDVGMVEHSRELCFVLEKLAKIITTGMVRKRALDREKSFESRGALDPSEMNLGHSAFTEWFQQKIFPQPARLKSSRRVCR